MTAARIYAVVEPDAPSILSGQGPKCGGPREDVCGSEASSERRRHLADACHVQEPKILDQLEKLGFSEATVSLLCLERGGSLLENAAGTACTH